MPRAVEVTGRPASAGLARGPVVSLVDLGALATAAHAGAEAENARLTAAIEQASEQIAALMTSSDEEAAAILEFQIAMMEDDELAAPARALVAEGRGAGEAWAAALDAQIADYGAAEDEYFRARVSDLADIRQRVLRNLASGGRAQRPAGAVLVGRDLTPTEFLETDWSEGGAIVLSAGSPTSHVAMLARSRGIPMVTDVGVVTADNHDLALVNGTTGRVTFRPGAAALEAFATQEIEEARRRERQAAYLPRPAATADGIPVAVMVNIADPDEVDGIDIATCDGVGVMRTEFLFHGTGGLPGEEEQYRAYRRVLDWAGDKPVVIRTADAGGDKPIAGFTVEEANPFLGLRGIRLSLARPEIFTVQLRALARAATVGNLKIMLPMVTVPDEIAQARALLDEAVARLGAEGIPAARPPLGIMVEVPTTAITPERFAEADFFSIGSNDLTQYVTAAARDGASVVHLNDVADPAVAQLLANVAACGEDLGREVSLCGDAGGDPRYIPMLIRAGLRSLSVAPTLLAQAKATIAEVRGDDDG